MIRYGTLGESPVAFKTPTKRNETRNIQSTSLQNVLEDTHCRRRQGLRDQTPSYADAAKLSAWTNDPAALDVYRYPFPGAGGIVSVSMGTLGYCARASTQNNVKPDKFGFT